MVGTILFAGREGRTAEEKEVSPTHGEYRTGFIVAA
jgi:hypothetical protein